MSNDCELCKKGIKHLHPFVLSGKAKVVFKQIELAAKREEIERIRATGSPCPYDIKNASCNVVDPCAEVDCPVYWKAYTDSQKVKCPGAPSCGKSGCQHSNEHEPVNWGITDCSNAAAFCGKYSGKCEPVYHPDPRD
jgi:hypothetical protein